MDMTHLIDNCNKASPGCCIPVVAIVVLAVLLFQNIHILAQ